MLMYGRNQHSTAIIFQLKINKLKKKKWLPPIKKKNNLRIIEKKFTLLRALSPSL